MPTIPTCRFIKTRRNKYTRYSGVAILTNESMKVNRNARILRAQTRSASRIGAKSRTLLRPKQLTRTNRKTIGRVEQKKLINKACRSLSHRTTSRQSVGVQNAFPNYSSPESSSCSQNINNNTTNEADRRDLSVNSGDSSETSMMNQNMSPVILDRFRKIPFSTEEKTWLLEFIGNHYSKNQKIDWNFITYEHSKLFPSRKLQSLAAKYRYLTFRKPSRKRISINFEKSLQKTHTLPTYPMTQDQVPYKLDDLAIDTMELFTSTDNEGVYSVESEKMGDSKESGIWFSSNVERQPYAADRKRDWKKVNKVTLEPISPFRTPSMPMQKFQQTRNRTSGLHSASEIVNLQKQTPKGLGDFDTADYLQTKCKKPNYTNSTHVRRDSMNSRAFKDTASNFDLDSGYHSDGLGSKGSDIYEDGHFTMSGPRQNNVEKIENPYFSEPQREWLFKYVFEKWDLSNPTNVSAIDWRHVCLKFEELFGFYPSVGYLLGSVIWANFTNPLFDDNAKESNVDARETTSSILTGFRVPGPDRDVSATQIDRIKNIPRRRKSLRLRQVSSNVVERKPFTGEGITITPGPGEAIIPAMILDRHRVADRTKRGLLRSNNDILNAYGHKGLSDDFSPEEHKLFQSLYLKFPKKWEKIAAGMGRDFRACIRHYYMTKKKGYPQMKSNSQQNQLKSV